MIEESATHQNPSIARSEPRSDEKVRIVDKGNHWCVVEKPAGMLSVPGRGANKTDCVTARVRAEFPDADGPLNVHRLDMETSGLMVFGLSRAAHTDLSRQFMRRETAKAYVALLAGEVEGDEGRVELPLAADWPNRPRQKVCRATGKASITLWRVLARADGRTRVEFIPETGRTHQLRVHAAAPRDDGGLGAPIVGDSLYGDCAGIPRLMLHATRLSFTDPSTGERLSFQSDAPF